MTRQQAQHYINQCDNIRIVTDRLAVLRADLDGIEGLSKQEKAALVIVIKQGKNILKMLQRGLSYMRVEIKDKSKHCNMIISDNKTHDLDFFIYVAIEKKRTYRSYIDFNFKNSFNITD